MTNITDYVVRRQHARYGLIEPNADVTSAWTLLVSSAYAQDLSVQDGTGVPHLGDNEGCVTPASLRLVVVLRHCTHSAFLATIFVWALVLSARFVCPIALLCGMPAVAVGGTR